MRPSATWLNGIIYTQRRYRPADKGCYWSKALPCHCRQLALEKHMGLCSCNNSPPRPAEDRTHTTMTNSASHSTKATCPTLTSLPVAHASSIIPTGIDLLSCIATILTLLSGSQGQPISHKFSLRPPLASRRLALRIPLGPIPRPLRGDSDIWQAVHALLP